MKAANLLFNLAMVVIFSASLLAQQPTGREIMKKYKAQERTRDSSVELKMTLINARGGKRVRQVIQVTKTDAEGNRKALIRFLSPADIKGTGFLSVENSDRDDDNWLYLPALRKVRRIAGSDKTDSFMGTEFTYEDLEAEDLEAYEYKLIGSDTVGGVAAWIVEARAVSPKKIKETGYSKRELWISKDHYLAVQTKYYDKKGAYVKLYKASDIKQVPGTDKWRAYRMTMEDVRKGNKTVLEFSDYKINQGVPDKYFSQRYLKRGGR
ncbi:MAG: outer membrane lipoprotein-sorting protein [Calditrichaeota bacterium]|nr:outer membrane lipoprotein-sorting protein [Calditrichota bacterium]